MFPAGAVFALAWLLARLARSEPVSELVQLGLSYDGHSEGEQEDMREDHEPTADFEALLTQYYRSPRPDQVPNLLTWAVDFEWCSDMQKNACWYWFARIAQDNPAVLRRFEILFLETRTGRPVLLRILTNAGDEQTRAFLTSCLDKPESEQYRREIEAALQAWAPEQVNPLRDPVRTAYDLDLLWWEFLATGNTEPVVRLIDVLERPDHIRDKLNVWLHATPCPGFSVVGNLLRRYTVRSLREKAAIFCDVDRREVMNAQDLDCHTTMDKFNISRERAMKMAKLLPFSVCGEEGHMFLKAAARWSLASQAHQHQIVFDVCESEAAKRTGRCRILLLEIVGTVALARQDLQGAFTALSESLTPDPERDDAQRSRATAEWERLLRLQLETAARCTVRPEARDAALRCIRGTQSADTYRAKRLIRDADRTDVPAAISWECEFAQPANFRVFQTMWEDDGQPLYDEWITVRNGHWRGPAYAMWDDSSKKINPTLRADNYFQLLSKRRPSRFDVLACDDTRYLLFEYAAVPYPSGRFGRNTGVSSPQSRVLVWAEYDTGHLAKVVVELEPSPSTDGKRVEIVHMFSCYDEPVWIVPPAFSVGTPTPRTATAKLAGLARKASTAFATVFPGGRA